MALKLCNVKFSGRCPERERHPYKQDVSKEDVFDEFSLTCGACQNFLYCSRKGEKRREAIEELRKNLPEI
jgi:hypothetical protein